MHKFRGQHILTVCLLAIAQFAFAQEPTLVVVGSPLERQLKGGESQQFRIAAVSGQFLQLAVEQMGVDVVLDLFKPDGQLLISVDSPNGRYGSEDVAVITESSGDYRLEVRSLGKADPLGQFKLSVIALHSPTPTDLERVAAESAFNEAFTKLAPKRTAEARREAIEKCQVALAFFRSSGEKRRQAWIMNTISLLHAQSGNFRQAFDLAVEVLPIFRSVGDNLGISTATTNLGGMSDVLGEPQRALGYYEEALIVRRAAGDNEGIILNNIGKIYNDQADWQRSIEYYNQALPLFQGNVRLEATALHNIAVAYFGLGEFGPSLKFLQQALVLWRTAKDKPGEAESLTVLGDLTSLQGRSEEALEIYKQAMALRVVVGDRRNEGVTLDHIGIAYASMNQPERALEYHQQALERQRAAQSPRSEAISLGNIGHAYQRLNQPDKAVEFYSQALAILERLGDRQNGARIEEGLANAQRSLGNFDAALKHVSRALDQIESVRNAAGAQQARSAYAASRHGAYELYIGLLMQMHGLHPTAGYDAQALQASERARARSFIEMLNEARVDFRQGVDPKLIASERELGQRINAKAQRQIQIRSQKTVNAAEIRKLDTEISALESEYQQVQTSIRKNSPSYASFTQPKAISVKDIQALLDADTVLLEYALGKDRSYLWAITYDSLTSYELPKTDLIEKSARRVYESLTARNKYDPGETAVQRQERISRLESELPSATQALSKMVLSPAVSRLGGKRLVIVADGTLQYIPFAMLPDPAAGDQPLVVRHEIVNVPSASAMAAQRAYLSGRNPAPKGIAVIADPVFSAADVRLPADLRSAAAATSPAGAGAARSLEHTSEGEISRISIRRLPFTRQEADQILALAPKLSNLKSVDFDASRVTGTSSELSQYRYVHFATHGYLDTQRPGLSAIVLSLVDRQGKPQDGFLRTHDIYDLNLPAELVVLSACQTGLGKEVKGEGLIGLTRGFMYAGAKRVVVSLWSVNDKATSDLMTKFYRGMLKDNERPAAALRAAQIEMWKQKKWQSPYYWAAFTMQGEWR